MKIDLLKDVLNMLNEEEEDVNIRQTKRAIECILTKEHWKEKGFNIECNQSHETMLKLETDYNLDARIFEWGERCKVCNSKEQPKIGKWVLQIRFPTGAYIFSEHYDTDFFDIFFNELITKYKAEFKDMLNHCLYWYIDNPKAKEIAKDLTKIYKKYQNKYVERRREQEIKILEEKLKEMKKEGGKQ